MPLVNLRTNLKSLKFGKDRPGEGSSKQPYITTPIPGIDEPLPGKDISVDDFLLRGGIEAPEDAATDVVRLSKYFSDFNNIKGSLFVAKQNILSQVSVRTQASGAGPNEGIYSPLNTLAQAGIGFIGGHVDKQGLNFIKGVKLYGPAGVKNTNANTSILQVIGNPETGEGNRLVDLYNFQVPHQGNEFSLSDPVNVLSYRGGPNSALGIGKTNIKFATDNKGGPVLTGIATPDYQAGLRENPTNLFKSPLGVSSKYVELNGGGKLITEGQIGYDTVDGVTLADISKENGITWTNIDGTPPKPKLQNPTQLFINPTGDDATSMYMFTTGENVSGDLTSDDGVSWQQTLTNPYATGTKGTLATKAYVGDRIIIRDTKSLFQDPLGLSYLYAEQTSGKIKNKGGYIEIFNNTTYQRNGVTTSTGRNFAVSKENGITWENNKYNTTISPYVKPNIVNYDPTTKTYKNNSNPDYKFIYLKNNLNIINTKGGLNPLGLYALNNPTYNGKVDPLWPTTIDQYGGTNYIQNTNIAGGGYVTGEKGTLSANKYLNIPQRLTNYTDHSEEFSYSTFKLGDTLDAFLRNDKNSTAFRPQNSINKYELGGVKSFRNSKSFNIGPTGYSFSVYKNGELSPSNLIKNPKSYGSGYQNFRTQTTNQLYSSAFNGYLELGQLSNFTKNLVSAKEPSTIMSISPSYQSKFVIDNISGDNLYHYASPGQRGVKKNNVIDDGLGIVDGINYYPIYQSTEGVRGDDKIGDLVNFYIAAIDQKDPSKKDYIHFRAYIDSFEDSYTGNWDSIQYMGRGEKFHKYNSFERGISLSFTIAAQGRDELIRQYEKLNYLVSNTAPTYSDEGYMGGPLVTLTVGNWCNELPGFIGGMSLNIPEESPWEIDQDHQNLGDSRTKDSDVMQLPHIIKVTGFQFTPIHTFRPQKQTLKFETANSALNDGDIGNFIPTESGKQKYLAYRHTKPEKKKQSGDSDGRFDDDPTQDVILDTSPDIDITPEPTTDPTIDMMPPPKELIVPIDNTDYKLNHKKFELEKNTNLNNLNLQLGIQTLENTPGLVGPANNETNNKGLSIQSMNNEIDSRDKSDENSEKMSAEDFQKVLLEYSNKNLATSTLTGDF